MNVMISGNRRHLGPISARPQTPGRPWLKRLKHVFKFSVSAVFLAYLFHVIDLGQFYLILKDIRPEWYIASFMILIVNSVILAFKFKVVMAPSGIQQPLLTLIRVNFVSRFYALLFTPAVGQGAVRWYQTTKNQEGKLNFLPVMIFERASFIFILCLFMVVSGCFLVDPDSHALGQSILPIAVAGLLCLPGLYLVFSALFKTAPSDSNLNAGVNSFKAKILYACRSLSLFNGQSKVLIASTGIAFLWHSAFLLRVYFLFAAVNVHIDIFHLCWMASLVLLIQILPVSLNGIGLREGAYAYLFNLAGMPMEKGVLIGALFFTQMLIASAIGGIIVVYTKE